MDYILSHPIYPLLLLAAVFHFFWLQKNNDRLRMKWYIRAILSLLVVIHAILCAKFFAVAEYGFDLSRAGNMSLFGGLFGMPILYYCIAKISKRDLKAVFDIFAVCTVITVLAARCNCLISGCCLGRCITDYSSLRWPTREAEVLYYVLFLVFFIPKVYQKKTKGEVYPFYMFTYGVLRFVLEFFRVSDTNMLFHLSHVWALISIVIGATLYFSLVDKMKMPKKRNG